MPNSDCCGVKTALNLDVLLERSLLVCPVAVRRRDGTSLKRVDLHQTGINRGILRTFEAMGILKIEICF